MITLGRGIKGGRAKARTTIACKQLLGITDFAVECFLIFRPPRRICYDPSIVSLRLKRLLLGTSPSTDRPPRRRHPRRSHRRTSAYAMQNQLHGRAPYDFGMREITLFLLWQKVGDYVPICFYRSSNPVHRLACRTDDGDRTQRRSRDTHNR